MDEKAVSHCRRRRLKPSSSISVCDSDTCPASSCVCLVRDGTLQNVDGVDKPVADFLAQGKVGREGSR